jgi:hypothetical protein
LIAEAQIRVSSANKVSCPESRRTGQAYDDLLPKYYALANVVLFFYDYLLTLADEACLDYSTSTLRSLLIPRFVEDLIRLVREEIVEYAQHFRWDPPSADLWIVFWLFIFVSFVRTF